MTYKKKIILISPYPLIPDTSGGKKYILDGVKLLSKHFEYHLLAFINSEEKEEYQKNRKIRNKEYKKYFKTINFVDRPKIPHEKNIIQNILHFSAHIVFGLPLMDCSYFSLKAIKTAKNVINKNEIDIMECHHLHTSYLRRFIKIKSVFVYHNIESRLFPFWLLPHDKNIFIRFVWKIFGVISRYNSDKIELKNKLKYDLGLFISQKEILDVSNIKSLWKPPISKTYTHKKNNSKKIKVLWVGGFDWSPNKNAAEWFAIHIYPHLKTKINRLDISFHFIGKNPPAELKKISDDKKVFVCGYVDNIKKYWKEADIFIVPILEGGGVRIKIIEAMSHRLPIISTTKGAEGLPLENNKNILITNNAKEFANLIVKLAINKNLRDSLSNKSFEYIKKFHSYSSYKDIIATYKKL